VSKKVLIIVENLPVPFDTRVWNESRALCDAGYEVFVICPKGKNYSASYEIIDGVHIYRHAMPREGHGVLGYLQEYLLALALEFVLACKIFVRHRFDVIQGCNPPDNMWMIALFFKLFGVKYIFDHHDVNPELYFEKFSRKDLLYRMQLLLERLTFKIADVVMSTNESYRCVAIQRGGVAPERVFVVRNGPDLDTFGPVEPVPALKQGKRYLVGYVGTMSVQEGLDILLEMAQMIKEKGRDDVHFTCVGGGPGLKELERMKNGMGLDDIVNFTGRVPDKDLLEILSTADVCVNPDRPGAMNDMSTMIKIMEYMALEKPVVQFNLKEGRFSAGKASLYAGSKDDFANKILWLLDHPDERKRMGKLGRERIKNHLEWKYSIKNLLSAYKIALNE
jgi:glycosyltransferase involved in cell wall biosynthesis